MVFFSRTFMFKLKNIKICCWYKCLALSKCLPSHCNKQLISLFTRERRNQTFTTALLSLSFVPLAPTHGHHSQKRIHCFLFVSAMTELFIVEADVKWLFSWFSLHLLFSNLRLLLCLSHQWHSVQLFHPPSCSLFYH